MGKKKALLKSNFIIKMHVYPIDVMVSLGSDKGDLQKMLISQKVEKNIAQSFSDDFFIRKDAAGCTQFNDCQVLIATKVWPETCNDFAILIHEIFHAVCFIMRSVEIKYCEKSEEAFAYAISYISKRIFEEMHH